jgi:hypothetical protein
MDEIPGLGHFGSEKTDVLRKRLDVLRRPPRSPVHEPDLLDGDQPGPERAQASRRDSIMWRWMARAVSSHPAST